MPIIPIMPPKETKMPGCNGCHFKSESNDVNCTNTRKAGLYKSCILRRTKIGNLLNRDRTLYLILKDLEDL